MTPEEFVLTCVRCGYASKKNALEYVQGKTQLVDEDFVAVHNINEHKLYVAKSPYIRGGSADAEHLLDKLNDRPLPWNRIFDASKGWAK